MWTPKDRDGLDTVQARDLARYFLGEHYTCYTAPGRAALVFGLSDTRLGRRRKFEASSWRAVFAAAGVRLPIRTVSVAGVVQQGARRVAN